MKIYSFMFLVSAIIAFSSDLAGAQAGPACTAIARNPVSAAASFPAPRPGQVVRYAIKAGAVKVTELARTARVVGDGSVVWQEDFVGPNKAGVQRMTSEFFGLFQTRVVTGARTYEFFVDGLTSERFGKLLKDKHEKFKGRYRWIDGAKSGKGSSEVKVMYKGCDGPAGHEFLSFDIISIEDGKSDRQLTTLDVKTGLMASSFNPKMKATIELIRP